MSSSSGGSVFRFIINLLILIIVVSAIYILGLMFHIIPLAYTPQVMFKDQYTSFKESLKNSNSGFQKNVYDFLDTMEKSYQPKPVVVPKPVGAPGAMAPAAAMTTVPATGMPGSEAPTTTTTVPVTTTVTPVPPSAMPAPTGPAVPTTPVPVTTTTTPVPPSSMPPVTNPPELPQVPVTPPPAGTPPVTAPTMTPQPADPITKAQDAAQQYQNSVNQQKKTLDSL